MDSGPSLFLSPVQNEPAPNVGFLKSTDDLLTRFSLLGSYQRHLQGKGKARALDGDDLDDDNNSDDDTAVAAGAPAAASPAGTPGPSTTALYPEDEKGYRALIRPCPGKHSMKRDPQPYLTNMALGPPRDTKPRIRAFDDQMLDGFRVSDEGIKGWSIKQLLEESKAAKEERRKRKAIRKARIDSMNLANQRKKSETPGTPSLASVATPGTAAPRGVKRQRESTSSPSNSSKQARTPLPVPASAGIKTSFSGGQTPTQRLPGTPSSYATTPHRTNAPSTPTQPSQINALPLQNANSNRLPRPSKKQRVDPPMQQPTPTPTTS